MIREQCNEVVRTPASNVSSQSEVITLENNERYKIANLDDEFNQTNNEHDQRSWYSENEVSYAAETLLRMANDVSCLSKLCDFENDFAFQNERDFWGSDEIITGKMGFVMDDDDSGILSDSLDDGKNSRNFDVRCSCCGLIHFGTCSFSNADDGENEQFKMMKMGCGSNDDDEGEVITPSVRSGFSLFSIIHLLSVVRLALVSNHLAERCKENDVSFDHKGLKMRKMGVMCESYYLSVDEIAEEVRLKPGDPRILESKAQLEDLIRGALRVFSDQVSLSGGKKWKKLAKYDKTRKGWSWVGPIPCLPLDLDDISAACAPEFWGVSKKMLAKMVDCFADWFKANQNALIQRASLQLPPLALSLTKDNSKDRFQHVIKSKSCLATIRPCLNELRAYFHAEERIRYMIPDRAFAYTAVDGRKSSVAPVRKCREKVSPRARDHHLLISDRPSCITILTVVRDAAARLPGAMGTRGDVAVLVRDSQYLVKGISDEQMSQVVSGGLDRLHYERDPCVRFDRQRRLWVYLHGDREEEEFDDDGRQSMIMRWTDRGRRV